MTGLYQVARQNLKEYGSYVLSDRAIPDARDGLKPVQRAILYAAKELGLSSNSHYVKSARVVGHAMANYHPHGDSSIYEAAVNMAQMNLPVPLIDGKGNWGSADGGDDAAASRYTEMRLSAFADSMLDPLGLAVIDTIANYDDTKTLPLVLPAKEPTLLYNGAQGIAYGTVTAIPPLARDGVLRAAKLYLQGTPPSTKELAKILTLNYKRGGRNATSPQDWHAVIEQGRGSLVVEPVIHTQDRSLIITEVPPYFNWDKAAAALSEMSEVRNLSNQTTNKVRFVIECRKATDLNGLADKIRRRLASRIFIEMNAVTRSLAPHGSIACQFHRLSFPQFFERWCAYRLKLEERMIDEALARRQKELDRFDLLLKAVHHLERLVKILRKQWPSRQAQLAAIASLLKCTEEESRTVLQFTLSRLSSIEQKGVEADRASVVAAMADLRKRRKNPAESVARSWA